MRSSTSSTEKKEQLLWKLALWTAAVFLLYAFMFLLIPKSDDAPDMYDTNILKAQTYMSAGRDFDTVITGSSMCADLKLTGTAGRFCNLAFHGGCSLTGLELIVEKGRLTGRYPKTVFVEMNISITGGADDDIIGKASGFDNAFFNRIEYRPDYLFYSLVKYLYYGNKEKSLYDGPVIKERADYWAKVRSEETGQDELNARIEETRDLCDILKLNGVRVIMIEPPNDPVLYDLPQSRQVRETALAYFPESDCEWFTVDWNDYVITDGIHMGKLSAKKYSDLLSALPD